MLSNRPGNIDQKTIDQLLKGEMLEGFVSLSTENSAELENSQNAQLQALKADSWYMPNQDDSGDENENALLQDINRSLKVNNKSYSRKPGQIKEEHPDGYSKIWPHYHQLLHSNACKAVLSQGANHLLPTCEYEANILIQGDSISLITVNYNMLYVNIKDFSSTRLDSEYCIATKSILTPNGFKLDSIMFNSEKLKNIYLKENPVDALLKKEAPVSVIDSIKNKLSGMLSWCKKHPILTALAITAIAAIIVASVCIAWPAIGMAGVGGIAALAGVKTLAIAGTAMTHIHFGLAAGAAIIGSFGLATVAATIGLKIKKGISQFINALKAKPDLERIIIDENSDEAPAPARRSSTANNLSVMQVATEKDERRLESQTDELIKEDKLKAAKLIKENISDNESEYSGDVFHSYPSGEFRDLLKTDEPKERASFKSSI